MNRKYIRVTPQESAVFADIGGSAILETVNLASFADLAAEAATKEASQVSATLAAAALSLTRLKPDAMHGLLRHP